MIGTPAQQQIVVGHREVPLLRWAAWAELVGPDGTRHPFDATLEQALLRLHHALCRDRRRQWGRIRVTVHRSWLDPQVRLLAECNTVPRYDGPEPRQPDPGNSARAL